MNQTALFGLLLVAAAVIAAAEEPVPFQSPGFPPTHLDADGRLVEDWGTLGMKLSGENIVAGPGKVEPITLDALIPAAQSVSPRGAVTVSCTAYRAPVFPAGVDVLQVRLAEAQGRPAQVTVALDLPAGVKLGQRTVRLGNRILLTQSGETAQAREARAWGHCDEATSLSGWAKPEGQCDLAFRNIRAGLGGVPIVYRFTVPAKSAAQVVLGFCESHWAQRNQRPLVCRVEGAPQQQVDPVAKWGQHKPGVLLFKARDANGDGQLEIQVRPAPGANDRNPILNAIWIFPAGEPLDLGQVVGGDLSKTATWYVAVGGDQDQSLYREDRLEYPLSLPAGGVQELTFFVACQGGSAPSPEACDWTVAALRRAALEVWRDWPKR
ncbi:MAG: hypothetical protein NTY19_33280 [Planctomycetota bacterium]|nr:hypothetical protein [Planctomycetota bacterium]